MMSIEHDDPEALLATLHQMEMDDAEYAVDNMTDEEVARALEAEGGDPVAIGEEGAKIAAALLERRKRLAWQAEAAVAREQALARIAKAKAVPRGTREEMLQRIKSVRRDLGLAIAAAFRKGGAEAATDDELAAIVDEIALLEALHEKDDDV
jgi:hypothetical protein